MHGKPHTMTAKFADHGIAVFPGKGLDGRANVAQRVLPANSILHAAAETFLRDAYEIPAIVRHVSEHEHAGSIPNISLVDGRGIDVDDITVFKDHIGAWDAVTDYIVHRGADAFRKALKIKAGRSGIVADRIFVDNAVNFFRRHTHVDCLSTASRTSVLSRPASRMPAICSGVLIISMRGTSTPCAASSKSFILTSSRSKFLAPFYFHS